MTRSASQRSIDAILYLVTIRAPLRACPAFIAVVLLSCGGINAATPFAETAARVDALLREELPESATSAPTVDDVAFLRRATQDLLGENPSPDRISIFALSASPNKRAQAVEQLLADPRYGLNWGRYWRDVIMYHRSDERGLVAAPAAAAYFANKFNGNAPWDQIARDYITARGDIDENGAGAVVMAQLADPANVAAEISRIFLGMQIQCAQCHNHPTDHWKREQFHQFAAFFARVGVRPERSGEQRSFRIVSLDRPAGARAPGVPGKTTVEHYMPDLDDPTAQGTMMRPTFFVSGQSLPFGASDKERREQLAQWLTSPAQPWFARAFVNRLWTELVGQGFYEPADDIGPDRAPRAPKTLDYLATQFVESHYDIKWLFQSVMATAAYSRASRSIGEHDRAPLVDHCPQRLRADQLYNSLVDALGIDESAQMERDQQRPRRALFNGPRGQTMRTFGYDPSVRHDEVLGSIPQALFMMNSGEVNRSINARRPESSLGKLLEQNTDNRAAIVELYLKCLARAPKPSEMDTCLLHVAETKDRRAAFEDLLWALVNSTEFLHRN